MEIVSMVIGLRKKIELFNDTFQEFLAEYRTLSGIDTVKAKKIKTSYPLMQYFSEVKLKLDKFMSCEDAVIPELTLLNKINIDPSKCKINWEYLHNLYFITLPVPDPELIQRSKDAIAEQRQREMQVATKEMPGAVQDKLAGIDISALQGMANNPETQNLNTLINDIAHQISGSLQGMDLSKVDPTELLTNLMSGNNKACGIDFTS